MKRIIFMLTLAFLFGKTGQPQSCLPSGITFTTQAEIDNFQASHPNCSMIEGSVKISGNDITNLNGLNVLTSIAGNLKIGDNNNLNSLSGLQGLISIGGDLSIGFYETGYHYNPALTTLSGLENLSIIGGSLGIMMNDALLNIGALSQLETIGNYLDIRNNYALTSLAGLNGLTAVGGPVYFGDNHSLTNLTGLENLESIAGFELHISSNASLQNLTGLEKLTTIGGSLLISDNPVLASLSGIDSINATTITELSIYDNPSLSTCNIQCVCNYLAGAGTTVSIHDNAVGCNTTQQVQDACVFSGIPDPTSEVNFTLFPCPAKNEITVTAGTDAFTGNVSIYNQLGQLIWSSHCTMPLVMDVSMLTPGMYVIELTNDKIRVWRKVQKI